MTYPRRMITKTAFTPAGPSPTGAAPGIWRLDEVAYWVKQGLWPDTNADPYWGYTSLLLSTTALGNANNNLFVDSSGAFNPISRNGNTTQGSFTPYGSLWSNYFDGSAAYLTSATSSNYAMSTGDFTIEGWFYTTASADQGLWDNRASSSSASGIGCRLVTSTNTLRVILNNTALFTTTTAVTLNQWNHIAVVRASGTVTAYLNGVAMTGGSATGTTSITDTNMWIGKLQDAGFFYNGYVSNFRVVKGTAVYTSNFTPSTTPLTAISGTSLLTCQSNRFIDASTNAVAITTAGTPTVTKFSPFILAYPGISYNQSDVSYWSGYFDGSGDYLSVPNSSVNNLGTSDFTIELWFKSDTGTMNTHACLVASYSSPVSGSWAFKAQSGTSGYIEFASYGPSWNDWVTTTNIAADRAWHHCAVTRSSNTLRIFVDGAVAGTWDISAASSFTGGGHPLTTGFMAQDSTSYLNGNISNLRIVKGTALYTAAFTPPTTPLTAVSGTAYLTCQNAAFTDNSTNNLVATINGNTTVTGANPFQAGYYSNYFGSSAGQFIRVGSSANLTLGSGSFTCECWVNPVSFPTTYGALWDFRNSPSFQAAAPLIWVGTDGKVNYQNAAIVSSSALAVGQWTHVAVVRNGSTVTIYFNGVSVASGTDSNTMTNTYCAIGAVHDVPASYYLNGLVSNSRVVVGSAVYTSAFTPPTSPLTAISGTALLTCQSGRFIDNSTNNFTVSLNGSPSVQTYNPFYTATIASNGGSMYFDGSGDYLQAPNSPAFALGSGDFTVEMWAYFLDTGGTNKPMFDTGVTTNTGRLLIRQGDNGSTANVVNAYLSGTTAGSPSFNFNQWTHVAVVRSSGTLKVYINGVGGTGVSATANLTENAAIIGKFYDFAAYFYGYMNGVRVTKGTAVYTANFTPPTAPLTPTPATVLLVNGMNAGAYDATTINDMETVGDAKVSTAVSKFGGSSMAFDGTGDYVTIPANPAFDLTGGTFTVECWIYLNSLSGSAAPAYITDIRNQASTTGIGFFINSSGYPIFTGAGYTEYGGTTAVSLSTWTHVAWSCSAGTMKIFINGVQSYSGSVSLPTSAQLSGIPLWIGRPNAYSYYLNGYIDDLRITKGVARYTTTFTPPTAAFPVY